MININHLMINCWFTTRLSRWIRFLFFPSLRGFSGLIGHILQALIHLVGCQQQSCPATTSTWDEGTRWGGWSWGVKVGWGWLRLVTLVGGQLPPPYPKNLRQFEAITPLKICIWKQAKASWSHQPGLLVHYHTVEINGTMMACFETPGELTGNMNISSTKRMHAAVQEPNISIFQDQFWSWGNPYCQRRSKDQVPTASIPTTIAVYSFGTLRRWMSVESKQSHNPCRQTRC